MSQENWQSHHEKLRESLSKSGKTDVEPKVYYSVGYNSPWTLKRRNEIWIEKVEQSQKLTEENNQESEDDSDEYTAERVPYEVLQTFDVRNQYN